MTELEDADRDAPISVAQEAMWFMTLLHPNHLGYNESISIRKDGDFDVESFRRAFNEIVRRHEAWRTRFDVVGGSPVQVVSAPPRFDLPLLDLSDLEAEEAEDRIVRVVSEISRVPYDLRRGPMLRPRLVKAPGGQHRLYLAMHHLIFDGVSVYRTVVPELIALYDAFASGSEAPLTDPDVSYRDFARWEHQWIESPRAVRRMNYWRTKLEGAASLSLPLDHRRPGDPEFRGALVRFSIPAGTVKALRAIAQEAGATLFQVLASGWSVYLSQCSGLDDVVFSTATDLRQRPEFESVVGCAVTALVIRVDMTDDPSFRDLVVRVRNELLDGLDNVLPFERLVRALAPETQAGANPFYETMIVLEPEVPAPSDSWSAHLIESEISQAVGASKLPLELGLDERPDGHIEGRLIFDPDLFERSSAKRMATQWLGILQSAIAEPGAAVSTLRTPGVDPTTKLEEWNATRSLGPDRLIHDYVTEQARRAPDAPAVSADGVTLTYAELIAAADQTAHRLASAGIGPGAVVAFCTPPSTQLVAGILGVLKAGAAYLVLDPSMPADLLDHMVSDSTVAAVYAVPELAARLANQTTPILSMADPEAGPSGDLAGEGGTHSDMLCCIQYDRDPDRPRGVLMRHQSVANVVASLASDLGLGSADTQVVLPSTFFGASAIELWLGLSVGAQVVLADEETEAVGALLSKLISKVRGSFLHATPERLGRLIDSGFRGARGLVALVGGGVLDEALADAILERARVLFHGYGHLEGTLYSTLARVEKDRPVTIGRPVANTEVQVLDRRGNPVLPGMAGSLVISGVGICDGYVGDATRRGDRLIEDPSRGRVLATGERARWRANGELELVVSPHPEAAHS